MMRLNDLSPAEWDRVTKNYNEKEVKEAQKTGLEKWAKLAEEEAKERQEGSMVDFPPHYNMGNIECIDAIEESMSSVAFKGYLKGNCMKYLWRYDYKGKQVQDLQKAGWYLTKLTAMVTEENN